MRKIDTHLHLIYPDHFCYPWLAEVPPLHADAYRLPHYREAARDTGIIGSVFMEVDVAPAQSLSEARYIASLADDPANAIFGIVAACRPEESGFAKTLEHLTHPSIKGLRRVLHTQPDETSRTPLFRANLAQLAARDFSFDLCVQARQLPLATELADACPQVRFMLDHCGSPPIADGSSKPWHDHIRTLAERSHVWCKLSGLPTCARPGETTAANLRPWFDHLLATFGPDRLVWGGDWPVCTLGTALHHWVRVTEELFASLTPDERDRILYHNAHTFYRLNPASVSLCP